MSKKDRQEGQDVNPETQEAAIPTYDATALETAEVAGRASGVFGEIRARVLEMIPKGQAATIGDVVKKIKKPDQEYRTIYNYVRNALTKHLRKVNGRVFIVNE